MRTSDDPLLKVTLNLYAADVDRLRYLYGFGWSAQARSIIHKAVATTERKPLTLGDLADE